MANLATRIPKASWPMIATLVRSIFEQADRDATWEQLGDVVDKLTQVGLTDVAVTLLDAADDVLVLSAFPVQHWPQILIVTPYYVKPPQRGLVEYYRDLGARTDLPLLVYHIPGRTAVEVMPETLEQIAAAAPTFVGMKHAVNDLGYVTDARRRLGDAFRIFVGLEDLSLPMLAVGATGLMNAVANVAPAEIAALYEAVASGDLDGALKRHDALFELNRAVFWDTNPTPIKYLMRRLGLLPTNEHRLPMMPATPELEARLDALIERTGLG
ncbi:MAG: dihydrodipicolinate synthase family protein [Actinobacteria bacterium]|nr:dihydrodipicolinate synthase family protein [Actinomycetota bacterium]